MLRDQDLELPTESSSAPGIHILDLNFDCLHKIFSYECFSVLDLCSIGETHSHFHDIVDDVFAKRFKNYCVNLWDTTEPDTTIRILSNFGPLIFELSICSNWESEVNEKLKLLLDLVTEHCSSSALQSLQLKRLMITEAETTKLQQIFDKLQKVYLVCCDVYSGKSLFSNCESLIDLEIEQVEFDDKLLALEKTFPKLGRFKYSDMHNGTDSWCDSNKSKDFFARHQNLKSLILCVNGDITHLLAQVADNCKQLAELSITIKKHNDEFEKAMLSTLTLDHLNILTINCSYSRNMTEFIPKLKDLRSLEILTLRKVRSDSEYVSALSKLTRLQVLKLWLCNGLKNVNQLANLERLTELKIKSNEDLDFDLISMIKVLINLKILYLDVWSFKMDKEMYQQTVDVVRKRPGRFQSALQISCDTDNHVSVNSFGDEECRKLVRIKNIDPSDF